MRKRQSSNPGNQPSPANSSTLRSKKFVIPILIVVIVFVFVGIFLLWSKHKDKSSRDTQDLGVNSIDNQISVNQNSVKSAASNEDKITALLLLASDYTQAKKYDDAILQYQTILQIDANNQAAIGGLIICYRAKKDVDNSVTYIQRMLGILEALPEKDAELIQRYNQLLNDAKKGKFAFVRDMTSLKKARLS